MTTTNIALNNFLNNATDEDFDLGLEVDDILDLEDVYEDFEIPVKSKPTVDKNFEAYWNNSISACIGRDMRNGNFRVIIAE